MSMLFPSNIPQTTIELDILNADVAFNTVRLGRHSTQLPPFSVHLPHYSAIFVHKMALLYNPITLHADATACIHAIILSMFLYHST